MIVLLDHDDSFVHSLARYVVELGGAVEVVLARKSSAVAIATRRPSHIILSPGPGTPERCTVALDLIATVGARVPILGVCLGHQCIGTAFGATVTRAAHPLHGSTSAVVHDGAGVLSGIPSPLRAARYHSLAIERGSLPAALLITAEAADGEIMGVRHRDWPIEGVQFHPESVLTEWGHRLLANFLGLPVPPAVRQADGITMP